MTEVAAKKVCTHSGTFHCDEALACYLLVHLTNEFKNGVITRTRDQAVIDQQDIVVDVGGVYDPSRHRYDHHQRSFSETLNDKYKTKLSSAGLVYKHFGREILQNLIGITAGPNLEVVYDRVYEGFIEGIDGIDNGVERYPGDLKPNYKVSTDLSARVGYLNPNWNESDADLDTLFKKAMALAGSEFEQRANFFGKVWLPARAIVEEGLKNRHEIHPSGSIVVLPQFCPWRDHLNDLEKEQSLGETIKYVLFGDSGGQWRVQCVPKNGSSFENRLSLLEAWRGLRDDELSSVSGVPGGVFVHATGFIGGNKTKEGAIEMAKKSLEAQSK